MKIGKSASETSPLLKMAYEEHDSKISWVFEWHRCFKEGDVHDDAKKWIVENIKNKCKCGKWKPWWVKIEN